MASRGHRACVNRPPLHTEKRIANRHGIERGRALRHGNAPMPAYTGGQGQS